jgi:hypothetical protein
LQLKRRHFDRFAGPWAPAAIRRIESEQLPTLSERHVDSALIAPTNDNLDVVMLTGLIPQPEVDRPTATYSPPHADISRDVCN